MAFALFSYSGTKNIGDAIQSIALSRLLPGPLLGVDRNTALGAECGAFLVANGWLGDNQIPEAPLDSLFAGIFVAHPHNFQWLRRGSFEVGARDPATCKNLQGRGIPADLTGCATLTFERYRGARFGAYAVDFYPSFAKSAVGLTHHICYYMSWADQWKLGLNLLELYRRAEVVYTSRLHVALPCLAFGTPVYIAAPDGHPSTQARFSILEDLGVRYDCVNEIDVSGAGARYRQFLRRNLNLEIACGCPQMPAMPSLVMA